MRKLSFAAAAAATALFGWTANASADIMSYVILVNGATIGSGTTTTGSLAGISASGDGFTVVLDAVGAPAQPAPYLSTNNFSIATTGAAGTVVIEVSDVGLTSAPTSVSESFTTNSLDGGGFTSDTISNYYDNTDTAGGMGTLLGTETYTGQDSFSSTLAASIDPTGMYSETTLYTLNFASGAIESSVAASSQIVATTPEPNSLVLLGTGLVGAAGLLFMRRRNAAEGLL